MRKRTYQPPFAENMTLETMRSFNLTFSEENWTYSEFSLSKQAVPDWDDEEEEPSDSWDDLWADNEPYW